MFGWVVGIPKGGRKIMGMGLRRIVAILKPLKLDAVVEVLGAYAVGDIEVSEVRGYGRQKGHLELYAGREYELNFLPKVRVELTVRESQVSEATRSLADTARTGRIGDGKIFVLPIEEQA